MSLDLTRKRQLEEFQRRLGIKFSNLELFDQALTHISYAKSLDKEDIPYNESCLLYTSPSPRDS